MAIIQPVITGGGTTPTGTLPITNNGTYDVTNYASADVNVPTTAPASYRAFEVNRFGKLVNSTSTPWVPFPVGTTKIDNYITAKTYQGTPANILSGVIDLSSIVEIGTNSFDSFLRDCSGITSVDLSGLVSVGQYGCIDMLANCTGLTSLNLNSIASINLMGPLQRICDGCTSLTDVKVDSCSNITGMWCFQQAFQRCTSLTTLSFPSAKSFGYSTNQFDNMLSGVTGCTVHFPSNLQSVIGSWTSVTNGFGGTNTTVLFDLPATNTLTGADSVTYTRNPKYDTATALAWKTSAYGVAVFTPAYYTSSTTDPAVSDTIYSDSACTTAVTTIDSIS